MTHDPRQSFELAFRHLDAFSLPGIGTFRRLRFSAVVDHQAGKINPPGERFVLEKGEGLVDRLVDFYFRFHTLSIGNAKALCDSVAAHIRAELEAGRMIQVAGIGTLSKSELSGYVLDASSDQVSAFAGSGHFGLAALNFNLNQHGASELNAKEEAAKRYAELKANRVEAAPKPIRGHKRKGGVFRGVMVALLLLIMVGSAAGIVWQEKFQGWMQQMGWMSGPENPIGSDTLPAPKDSQAVVTLPQDTIDAALARNGKPTGKVKAKKDLEPQLVGTQVDRKKEPEKEKPSGSSPSLADWGSLGEQAVDGKFYLVVGARKDAEGAREIAGKITALGIKAKVLVPRIEGPHYKVIVYQDHSKAKVIAKMVEWKNKFPEKSWIFWVGM